MHTEPALRIGAVSYLNTKPLIYGLQQAAPHAELVLDVPSRLADQLSAGQLDVALIPSIEFFQDPTYSIISNACIGCRGPVWSVKLFFRVAPSQTKTLALDEGSRTSAVLAQILLQQRYGIRPQLLPFPLGQSLAGSKADAVLLIGDRAMQAQPGPFAEVWDLGDQWCRWSELSFVFAMWVARPGANVQALEPALMASRDAGMANVQTIAEREAPRYGLTVPECLAYFCQHLYYELGNRELQGLQLYYQLASELGLAPKGVPLESLHCPSVG